MSITSIWMEIIFDVCYLVAVWTLVALMVRNRARVPAPAWRVAKRVIWAFALLALGDSGHVGFRVVAYALGDLSAKPVIFGIPVSLVGVGALATAITLTFFYMLMIDVWRLRFGPKLGWAGWVLLAAGVARLIVMTFPQNQWELTTGPYPWGLIRNLFLTVQGVGVMALFLRDAGRKHDRPFTWIAIMIALSFTFYAPVILWVSQVPLLGMLMMPKTLAYLGVAIIAYRAFFSGAAKPAVQPVAANVQGGLAEAERSIFQKDEAAAVSSSAHAEQV
jgi:hypothetical protein